MIPQRSGGQSSPMAQSTIDQAYSYCERVTSVHAKSFYFAARFLPRHKQKAVFAVYAFCRHVDDEVDEAGFDSEEQASAAVGLWKERLDRVYGGSGEKSPEICDPQRSEALEKVFRAWNDVLRTYRVPKEAALDLIKGVLMDTYKKRYGTFEELYEYCYRVASTVGLMSSEILGYSDQVALEYAEKLGVAMQLTNILRDVREDALLGRIYLPREDLEQFGVSEQDINSGRANRPFRDMLRFEIERAREYYREGEKGIAYLERDSRFTVLFASRIYSRILDEIESLKYDVFSQRAHTSRFQKLAAMPSIWMESRRLEGKAGAGE